MRGTIEKMRLLGSRRNRVAVKKQQLEDEQEERDEAEAEAAEAKKAEEVGRAEAPWVRKEKAEYRKRRRAIREQNKIMPSSESLAENFIKASLRYLEEVERKKREELHAIEGVSKDGRSASGGFRSGNPDGKSGTKKRAKSSRTNQAGGNKSGSNNEDSDGSQKQGIRIFLRDDKADAEYLEWERANSIASM